jgi:putative ABC transport system substrate-binding protein
MDAFRQALRELGWMQGQNIAFDYKYHEPGRDDLLLVRAAELVRLDVDIIVAIATRSALAAQKATKTVPIVFASVSDPVDAGLVESIARPGGNITGIRNLSAELGGKRLELLKEMFPKISRVAVLGTMGAGNQPQMREIEDAADVLRIQLQPVRAEQPHDFEKAFTTIKIEGCEALITLSTPWFDTYKARIVELAASHRLPAIYPRSEFVEDGGLMAYGVSGNEQYRRAAWYVDKVLKGTKPANLPVEQPTKFELVINLKAAKQIGLTIPPQMLMDADRVIKY